jgi:hypothetical protein
MGLPMCGAVEWLLLHATARAAQMNPQLLNGKKTISNGNGHAKPHGYVQIIVTKGNPSRGRGYEIAHFVVRQGGVKSISDRDVFVPSLTKAAQWVWRRYPSAKLDGGRNDHTGHLAALRFRCNIGDLLSAGSR